MRDGSWQGMSEPESQKPAKTPPPKSKAALALEDGILDALARNGAGTLSPPEIAHVIETEGDWHALLMPIRRAAVSLALDGRLVIYRKGKPVEDPNDFRGVYRLGLPKDG
jgi:hypothetical protein